MKWSDSITQYRRLRGLKQAALAEVLGVSQSAVSRWERGLDVPTPKAQRQMRGLMAAPISAREGGWLRTLVRQSRVSGLLDAELRVREISDELLRIMQIERSDIVGRTPYEFVADEGEALRNLQADGFFDGAMPACRLACTCLSREGRLPWIAEVRLVVASDGEAFLMVFPDQASPDEVEAFLRANPRGYQNLTCTEEAA